MKNNNFEFCNVELTALTPVHIGDGTILNKKDIYTVEGKDVTKIFINDQIKLYDYFVGQGKEEEFIQYLLNTDSKGIKEVFNVTPELYKKEQLAKYILSYGDKGKINNIHAFIKDAYDKPYIPGSSLKGMIKSAILVYKLSQDSQLQHSIKEEILKESKKDKMDFKDIDEKISSIFDKKFANDCEVKAFSGVVVSDSSPIPISQLQLVKKIDYKLPRNIYQINNLGDYKNEFKELPTYKEVLRKLTKTNFFIKIDKDKLNIDLNYIKEALNYNQGLVHKYFYKEFEVKEFEKGVAHLGGGVGCTSKTILYQLFGDDAKDLVYKIIMSQIDNRASHNPFKDILTPHVLKGYTKNLKEEMGRVRLIFKD